MKNIRLSIMLVALLLPFGSQVAHAEAIGRVIVAVGDTTALRNGVTVKLARGEEVQSGDTLRVGEASNMQVRFTDEGITALRSNSELRIDDYKFESEKNVGKSFFSLVKGGMRSITGLIGRFNRDNYAVKATSATIGIRGTHFVLAQCSNDCFNKDGSKAEDGLFGGVTDGRIAVNNQAGEKEFGKNEFFHVPSSDVLPKPLLAPPSFLRDQLEGQAKGKGGKPPAATVATSEGGATAAASPPPAPKETPSPVLEVTQFIPTEQPVVQAPITGGLINTLVAGQVISGQVASANATAGRNTGSNVGGSGTQLYGYSESWAEQFTVTVLDPTKLALQVQDQVMMDFILNKSPLLTFYMDAYSKSATADYYYYGAACGFTCVGTLNGTASYSMTKTASTDTGADALAGNLSWGRYNATYSETVLTGTYAGNTATNTAYEHWATGDPVSFAAVPTAGTYSYAYVGGTSPTDQNGNVGTIISGGTVGVTFNPGGASVTLTGASWNMPVTGNTYSMSFSNQPVSISQSSYSSTNPAWTASGTSTFVTTITNAGTTCSGACSNNSTPISINSTVSPMLFGANAQGLAAGVSTTMPASGTSPAENTASVQVYKR